MWPNSNPHSSAWTSAARVIAMAAVLLLLQTFPSAARAQSDDSKPEELTKQRTALYLKATHAPLAELGNDVHQIAVLSETCRIKYGSTACGLSDKALESATLEDRYAYYVRQPVEAHAKGHVVKIDRRHWAASDAPPPRP